MNDTPTDTTAPDAITQAGDDDDINLASEHPDRCYVEACADSLNIPDWQPNREVWSDLCEVAVRLTATTPRLAAHGAGEGLREALRAIAREPFRATGDMNVVEQHDAYRGQLLSVRARLASLATPPTDAGSTTREGEKVERTADAPEGFYGKIGVAMFQADAAGLRIDQAINFVGNAALAALATTSSPDASPDSGEAFNAIERVRNVITEFIECARLRGDNELPHPCDDSKLWTARMTDAWGELEALADDDPLAALHPSPEAPANRQEAGEVEVGAEDNARADAWADFRDQHLEDGNDGYIAAAMYERARVAFDEGWAGGRAPAFSHAFAALTSPKDVKGGEA